MIKKVKYHFVADTGLAGLETYLLCFICLADRFPVAFAFSFSKFSQARHGIASHRIALHGKRWISFFVLVSFSEAD
jgi:hypothetical protein